MNLQVLQKIAASNTLIIDCTTTGGRSLRVAVRYELMGMSADKIIDEYPHLKLEQVHDALSYYYAHKDEFDKKFREDKTVLSQLKKKYPSKLKARIG